MFIKDWKREVFTIPNVLSMFRLLLIPVYTIIYLNAREQADYMLAAAILAISCTTDLMDGMVARQFNMVSNVGKVLDPLADKLTQLSLTVCLSIRYPVLRGVLILLVIKEVFQLTAVVLMFRRGKVLAKPLAAGKLCTAILFISFIILMLMPALPQSAVTVLAVIDSVFLSVAFIGYFHAFFGRKQKLQDL